MTALREARNTAPKRNLWAPIADCTVLLAIAAACRFAWLDHASLWIDELFSVSWSQLDPGFLLGEGARTETNPPGYYVLLHGWMAAFGQSEFTLRTPSALASTATVLVVYALGRLLADRPVALLAAILMAINPVAVATAQEARAYALSALCNGLGLLAITGRMRHAERGSPSWGWLALFVVSSVAAVSLHYTSFLFVAAGFAAVGLQLATKRPFPVREALAWAVAGVLTALLLLKLLTLAASLSGSNNLVWIGPLTGWSVASFFLSLTVPLPQDGPDLAIILGVLGLLLLVVLRAVGRLWTDRTSFCVLVLVPALYCALLIGASLLRPMLLARVATWLVIPFCLLLAQGARGWFSRIGRFLATVVPVAIFLALLGYHYTSNDKEDWREAARILSTHPECGGPALVSEFNALGLHYYHAGTRRPVYVFLPDPRRRNSVEFSLSKHLLHTTELEPGEVAAFIEQHPGTALIMRGEYVHAIPRPVQHLLAHARLNRKLDGNLTVACF